MGQAGSKENIITERMDPLGGVSENSSDSDGVDVRCQLKSFQPPPPISKPAFLPTKNLNRNWCFWSLRSERIRQLYLKHSEKFGGEFFSRYGVAELFFEKISEPEAIFDTSIFFQLLQVQHVNECFDVGSKQEKKRLVIQCKEINTAENLKVNDDEKRVKLISENELAEVLSVMLIAGDLLVVFGDFNIQSAKTVFLNNRFQHPVTIAHMRFVDEYKDFDTSEDFYTGFRMLMRNVMIENEFHSFGSQDQAMCVRPMEVTHMMGATIHETFGGNNQIDKRIFDDSENHCKETNESNEAVTSSNLSSAKVCEIDVLPKKKFKASNGNAVAAAGNKSSSPKTMNGLSFKGKTQDHDKRRAVSTPTQPMQNISDARSSSECGTSSSNTSWDSSNRRSKLKHMKGVKKNRYTRKHSVPVNFRVLPALKAISDDLKRLLPRCSVELRRLTVAELEQYGIRDIE